MNVDVFRDGWMDGRREIWRRHKIWLLLSGSVRALMTNLSYVLPHITLIISDRAILSFLSLLFPSPPPVDLLSDCNYDLYERPSWTTHIKCQPRELLQSARLRVSESESEREYWTRISRICFDAGSENECHFLLAGATKTYIHS